jgi:hypothetical protein
MVYSKPRRNNLASDGCTPQSYVFHLNVDSRVEYTVVYPKNGNNHNYCCENTKAGKGMVTAPSAMSILGNLQSKSGHCSQASCSSYAARVQPGIMFLLLILLVTCSTCVTVTAHQLLHKLIMFLLLTFLDIVNCSTCVTVTAHQLLHKLIMSLLLTFQIS